MHYLRRWLGCALVLSFTFQPSQCASPCFSQLQVLGSHNAYHQPPPKPIQDLLSSELAQAVLPKTAFLPQAWQYGGVSIADQLAAGVRAFEIDVHPDPTGGLYASPAMLKFAGTNANLPDPALKQPGYKVLHIPDIDFATTCVSFVSCLTAIRTWSSANPTHVPITITVETSFGETDLVKLLGPTDTALINAQLAASSVPGPSQLITQPPASKELLTALENEILSVFPTGSIVTPDFVRTALNLPASADLTKQLLQAPTATFCPWPNLETLRGKVIFNFIFPDENIMDMYRQLHPGQKGAVGWLTWDYGPDPVDDAVFATVGNFDISLEGGVIPPAIPSNAFKIIENFTKEIEQKAKLGYLVRARADVDTVEARAGYVGRVQAVFQSSANVVSTDFAVPTSVLPGINYSVKLPGGEPARCVNSAVGVSYNGAEVSCNGGKSQPVALLLGPGDVEGNMSRSVDEQTSNPSSAPPPTVPDAASSGNRIKCAIVLAVSILFSALL